MGAHAAVGGQATSSSAAKAEAARRVGLPAGPSLLTSDSICGRVARDPTTMLPWAVQVCEYQCALADPSAAKEHLPCAAGGRYLAAVRGHCRASAGAASAPGGAAPALPPGVADRIGAASTAKLRDEYVV
eukprot:6194744-Pleurochrysis_carterae.AAC.1